MDDDSYFIQCLGHEAAEHISNVFQRMALPVPDNREMLQGRRSLIIFHPTAALVLRLALNEKRVSHPLVLPEFGCAFYQRKGAVRLSVLAGLNVADVEPADVMWLNDQLKQDDIDWGDAKLENVGLLPFTSPECPRGVPAVIDPDILSWRFGRPKFDCGAPEQAFGYYCRLGVNRVDARFWCNLTSELQQLWARARPQREVQSRTDVMAQFWQLAEKSTKGHPRAPRGDLPLFERGWERTPIYHSLSPAVQKAEEARIVASTYRRRVLYGIGE